jgi:hypothetical protein
LSEKEFKNGHKGDLAGAGLLMQSEVKVHSGGMGRLKDE